MTIAASALVAMPLAAWERDGLAAALAGSGLPGDDVAEPGRQFWRFETASDVPVGFGGLEIHGADALMRSVVTLPPMRKCGFGGAIVEKLEAEARMRRCSAVWLLTAGAAPFFARRGYATCDRASVPETIRTTRQFAALCPDSATVMVKRLG